MTDQNSADKTSDIERGRAVVFGEGKKSRSNKKILAVVLIACIVLGTLLFLLFKKVGTNVDLAARVGGVGIEKSEINQIVRDSEYRIDYKAALEIAIETKKLEQIARSESLELNETELLNTKIKHIPTQLGLFDTNRYTNYVVTNAALKSKLQKESNGSAAGVLYKFPFTRYYHSDYEQDKPLTGNPQAMEADRVYAQSKAGETRARVEAGEDPTVVLEELNKDPRLVGPNSPNGSMKFTIQDFELGQGSIGLPEIRDGVFEFGRRGITEVKEARLPKTFGTIAYELGEDPEVYNAEKIPVYYYFLDLEFVLQARGNNWLEERLATVEVQRYE